MNRRNGTRAESNEFELCRVIRRKRQQSCLKTKIEKYLAKFPTNATSWAEATDEVRDLARTSREYLEDYEEVIVEAVDFRALKTPAEWNTKGRAYILANFERMKPETQAAFYNRFQEWFNE